MTFLSGGLFFLHNLFANIGCFFVLKMCYNAPMSEITQKRAKKKRSLLEKHGISSMAAPTAEDKRKFSLMTPQERKALWDEGILHAMSQTPKKVHMEDIRARALKRLGIHG